MTKKPEDIAVEAAMPIDNELLGTSKSDSGQVVLDRAQIKWIREALHIGLYCVAQVEQLEAQKAMIEGMGGIWPNYLDVRHPGETDTVRNITDLLIMLDGYDC